MGGERDVSPQTPSGSVCGYDVVCSEIIDYVDFERYTNTSINVAKPPRYSFGVVDNFLYVCGGPKDFLEARL